MKTEQITLFDVDNEPIQIKFKSKYQKWKYENKYRKADNSMRCANCKHIIGTRFYKCKLLGLSCSSATDIRLSNVCDRFEEYIESEQE